MFPVIIPTQDIEYNFSEGEFKPLDSKIDFKTLTSLVLNPNYLVNSEEAIERIYTLSGDFDKDYFGVDTATVIIDLFVCTLTDRIEEFIGDNNVSFDFISNVHDGILINVSHERLGTLTPENLRNKIGVYVNQAICGSGGFVGNSC